MIPKLGDIVRGREVQELAAKYGSRLCVWAACVECGAERWVMLKGGKPQSQRCYPCGRDYAGRFKQERKYGSDHPSWRGGRHITSDGYVMVVVHPDDPLASMADDRNRIYEHRLVMARHLGRVLRSDEEVHHRDEVKDHNSLDNLELLTKGAHLQRHWAQGRRVAELEAKLRAMGVEP